MQSGNELTYTAKAEPENPGEPAIEKVEIYDSDELIKTVQGGDVSETLTLAPGTHYLSLRAYNAKGESTQSDVSVVYVKPSDTPEGFEQAQIGATAYSGMGGSWQDSSGHYNLLASGRLGKSGNGSEISGIGSDSCDFMYKELSGDFKIIVNMASMPKTDNASSSGIMIREGLDGGDRMVMLADGWLKYGENVRVMSRTAKNADSMVTWFKNASGAKIENNSSYNTTEEEYKMPSYLCLERRGDTVTASVSNSGTDFSDNPRQPQDITLSGLADKLYVGIAADGGQPTKDPVKEYMSRSVFGSLWIGGADEQPPTATPVPTPTPTATPDPADVRDPYPTRDPSLPAIPSNQAWTTLDENLNNLVTAAAASEPFGPYKDLYGYGEWTPKTQKAKYTHTDGTVYNFTKSWQTGEGSKIKRCFYFTPKFTCSVTVAYNSQTERPLYIYQNGNSDPLASGEESTTSDGNAAVITAEKVEPQNGDIYIYGGKGGKDIFGIFVDYYDPNETVYKYLSGRVNYSGESGFDGAALRFTDGDGNTYDEPLTAGGKYGLWLPQNKDYTISIIDADGKPNDKLVIDAASVSVLGEDKTFDINISDKVTTPTATPNVPTATPNVPTATPNVPTATPNVPTATPNAPTATPNAPTATPNAPTATPNVPTATPNAPTATPNAPTATPIVPTATPIVPTATPIMPTATPIVPTATPNMPTATPNMPTATPNAPTATPNAPTAAPTQTPEPSGMIYLSEPVLSGKALSARVLNNSGGNAVFIAAVYDGCDVSILKDAKVIVLGEGDSGDLSLGLNVSEGDTVRVFLWNEKLAPAAPARELK